MHEIERTNKMKKQKQLICLIFALLITICFCLPVFAGDYNLKEIELYPGGMPFGAKIISDGLTVVKFSDTQGKNASSAYLAGIREGDIITKINNINVTSIEDFVALVNKSRNNEIKFTVKRNQQELNFNVTPRYSAEDGKYKTGIWVKDSTSGIGTITFINPKTNEFGGLGHAICDSATGKLVPLIHGDVMDVSINGVIKGQVGTAGELKGTFQNKKIGTLTKNSTCGVFGTLSLNTIHSPENLMKICPKEELHEGNAYIWCTLDEGSPQKYSIEISNIDTTNSTTKNFKIKIVDENLLKQSGGIVQGMSGSPIIQNGKLVGAVTHVLINDPTTGYGIFIENMLNAANIPMAKAS